MLNRSFWKDGAVFLAEHTGFKGSWLSLWLKVLEARITGYTLDPPTQANLFEQAGATHRHFRDRHGRLRSRVQALC